MVTRRQFNQASLAAAVLACASLPGMAAAQPLSRRRIGSSKETLPVIGLGNSKVFSDANSAEATRLIDLFLEYGGGYVDLQGASRFNVGKIAQQGNRGDGLFLGSYIDVSDKKQANDFVRTLAAAQGRSQLDLANSRDIKNFRAQSDSYQALREARLVRYVGAASFGPAAMKVMSGLIKDKLVDFVQVNYSMIEPQAADHFLPLAQEHGVAVVINRPFINGNYFKVVKGEPLPAWAAEFDCTSWAQFSLKYILAHPAVTCVLTETSNLRHAVDNLGAGIGALPDAATRAKMLKLIQGMM
jgi:aryl-alcohol dehydrogenase-like predicted oxidoreductase